MSVLDTYYSFRFIHILTQKWENTDAYRLGIIDAEGNILKTKDQLKTSEEKDAISKFHLLVWNIKRLLDKVPLSKSIIGRFFTALALLKEHTDPFMTDKTLLENTLYNFIKENDTGGIDIVDKKLGSNSEETFGGDKVFTVSPEYFQKSRFGKNKYSKYSKFVGEDETGQKIREYGRANPKAGIVLKNSLCGSMLYLRKRN